ncbi:MAG: hypothetical protein Kow0047_21930 [Anaerolineae bacterium]
MLRTIGSMMVDVLLLRPRIFSAFRDHPAGFRRGVGWLVIFTLIANLSVFAVDLAERMKPEADAIAEARQAMEEALQQMRQFMPPGNLPPEFDEQFEQDFEAGLRMGMEIAGLPTVLPKPVSAFLEALGRWLSSPFRRLGGWLFYALWVMLVARLLGGQGSLRGFLAASSLYSVPHVADILSPVPCLGTAITWVTTVWGWIIYIKAIAVAHGWDQDGRTDWARAVAAAVIPALGAAILAFIAALIVGLMVALAAL